LHIGVLGLGQIGRKVAQLFLKYGFKVSGWSRSSKNIKGLKSYTGHDGLETMLSHSDYVIGILPSTRETDNLIDAEMLKNFKSSAIFINIGRGNLVVDNDLVDALNTGVLKAATLDVFRQEPLPLDHPFWDHSKIAITPHVSGWNVDDTIMDIAQNYLRLLNNERLLHEVDRDLGY
jgi:glyoxylate/hydroxypyruvate reductase A